MRIAALVVMSTLTAGYASADTSARDLDELEKDDRAGYWSLSFSGGAAFPLAEYADSHDDALGAAVGLAYTGKSGLGIGVQAGYSPLPLSDEVADDDPDFDTSGENHVAHAALAPRFTLGGGALRLVLGAGGGVLFEKAASPRTAAAALAHAGLELHILGGAGLTVGGSYLRSFKSNEAQLASAQAGFVMTF